LLQCFFLCAFKNVFCNEIAILFLPKNRSFPENSLEDPEMKSRVQELAEKVNMTFDEFIGEMRKKGCSEPTAIKIWNGEYENYDNYDDNNVQLSNLRKAAAVLSVGTGILIPK
jgi:hypothetical protein